ncbi:MAG TPA: hypothetical protein VLA62_09520, partial [Solirubrobacterales bacterium]|nr:hypothetical protein [Solirubrobacterales bacterium]
NLDAVRHSDGFVHRAFRTAPHHFASPHVAIQVVRSRDEVTWESEARFALGHAARRPATSRTGPAARIAASTTRPSCSGTTARRTWSDGAT